VPRHRGYEGSDEPTTEPEVTAPVEKLSDEELAKLAVELKDLKARDLAAKRAKQWGERPALGRAIYDVMQKIKTGKEPPLG
jgi:molecular chaperone DnaK (HSP70)